MTTETMELGLEWRVRGFRCQDVEKVNNVRDVGHELEVEMEMNKSEIDMVCNIDTKLLDCQTNR